MGTNSTSSAVIVSLTRTPIGRAFKGVLTGVRADDMAAGIVRAALDAVPGLTASDVDDLYLGCGDPCDEQGGNIARRVSVMLGTDAVPGATVNRLCASSLEATRIAAALVDIGDADVVVAAGVESISRYRDFNGVGLDRVESFNPLFDDAVARSAARQESHEPWTDPRSLGLLPDVYIGMGQTAENVASSRHVSREDQDEYALLSQQRTARAVSDGVLAKQITPLMTPGGLVAQDESPRPGTTLERLAELPTPFREDGTVTAGNACGLSDGASALVMMSEEAARRHGARPLARVVATATGGVSPEVMGLGPVAATRNLLRRMGAVIDDFDVVELNEAFAAQVLASQRELGIDLDRLNVLGGAIALGHPFGATGIRMLCSLLEGLEQRDGQLGLATLCIGGGQGLSMAVERM